MILNTTEMHIQLVKMLQKSAERSALCHFCECIHIFRETLVAIAVCSKMEHTELRSNSPQENIFPKCLVTAGRLVPDQRLSLEHPQKP